MNSTNIEANPQPLEATYFRGYHISQRYITRFHKKYIRGSIDYCWNWRAATNSHGTPQYSLGRHGPDNKYMIISAHRFAFALEFGVKWEGYAIKRTCSNKRCVNPYHFYIERELVEAGGARFCSDCGDELEEYNPHGRCWPCTREDYWREIHRGQHEGSFEECTEPSCITAKGQDLTAVEG